MEFECPFCPFKNHDSYLVVEHVECCHPENGESPFNVKEDEGMSRLAGGHREEVANASDSPGQDDEYFECDCGEVVILPEMNSHLILHESEETTVDEAVPATILPRDKSALRNGEDLSLAPMADVAIHPSKSSSSKSHARHRSRASSHKIIHGVKDLGGVLLGPESLPLQPKSARAKHKAPRRLGVRRCSTQVCFKS